MMESQAGRSARSGLPRLLLAAYVWLYAFCVGLVVLDVVYARELRAGLDAEDSWRIFHEISDFLLVPYALLGLAGGLTLLFGWHLAEIRRVVPVSLVLPLLALALAVAFGPMLEAASLGSVIRLLTMLAGSALAMLGLLLLPARQPD